LTAPGGEACFLDELAAGGWVPHVTEDALEAEQLAKSRGIGVGLVLLNPRFVTSLREQLEHLLAGSSLLWIALVPDQCETDTECWALIESSFFDYNRFPVDLDRLLVVLGHADGMARLHQRVAARRRSRSAEELMIGSSAVMRGVARKLCRIASVDAPVLITGETGTGKELAAQAIHDQSARAQGPFEVVNCAALPPSLIQTELFGHEKGSFTGAHQRRVGRFEMADGGTIFLDEIGDLPPDLQVTLLRILEQKKLRRVGATRDIPLDVRVLAATHVNLEQAVQDGRFREDLYYRLNVLRVNLPALRNREGDAEVLADHFLENCCRRLKTRGLRFTRQARLAICSYDWPGNVRELINCVERAAVMSESRLITPEDLGIAGRTSAEAPPTLEAARAKAEKEAVVSALYRTGHNLAQAARELGVSRVTVYRLIEKHEIDV
jgi:DNA-binding NtrC family response regulator